MTDHEVRIVPSSGARNLRDLGGYPTSDGRRTRWRTLFRSGCLDQLTPAGQSWLVQVGLRTVIDLREDDEVAERPNVLPDSAEVRYRRIPLFEGPLPDAKPPPLDVGYWRVIEQRYVPVRAVFEALDEPRALPALIHCHAGKDRTGVLVALILAAIGVQHATIAADYALSATCLGADYLDETREWFTSKGWSWEEYRHLAGAPAELMLSVLGQIESHYGGVTPYLASIGVSHSVLERLRELLTEAPGVS